MDRKTCTKCRLELPIVAFSVRRASPDGLSYKCRECQKSYIDAWRAENPTAFKEWAKANEQQRQQYRREWSDKNRDRRVVYMAEWSRANMHLVRAKSARRNARKYHATPSWANEDAIKSIYAKAVELTKLTGIPHEVDHVYPLQGKYVCGLHWEGNLQVITQFENIQKLNRTLEEWDFLKERRAQK